MAIFLTVPDALRKRRCEWLTERSVDPERVIEGSIELVQRGVYWWLRYQYVREFDPIILEDRELSLGLVNDWPQDVSPLEDTLSGLLRERQIALLAKNLIEVLDKLAAAGVEF